MKNVIFRAVVEITASNTWPSCLVTEEVNGFGVWFEGGSVGPKLLAWSDRRNEAIAFCEVLAEKKRNALTAAQRPYEWDFSHIQTFFED